MELKVAVGMVADRVRARVPPNSLAGVQWTPGEHGDEFRAQLIYSVGATLARFRGADKSRDSPDTRAIRIGCVSGVEHHGTIAPGDTLAFAVVN